MDTSPCTNGPDTRPLDPATGAPRPRTDQPGYYAGFSTMAQKAFWDDATRAVVEQRVHDVSPVTFFSDAEARLMQVLCDHLLPQGDRTPERRIPILNHVDERLAAGRIPGYRFASMPPDGDAYRLGFEALGRMAQAATGCDFLGLDWDTQEVLLEALHDGRPWPGAEDVWERMPVQRWWALVMGDVAAAYYAHPWAWDEIGFGGPAYPRGYTRLRGGEPEPWEAEERRVAWAAPRGALSDPEGQAPAQNRTGTH